MIRNVASRTFHYVSGSEAPGWRWLAVAFTSLALLALNGGALAAWTGRWLGMEVRAGAPLAAIGHGAVVIVLIFGLWRLRPWARLLGLLVALELCVDALALVRDGQAPAAAVAGAVALGALVVLARGTPPSAEAPALQSRYGGWALVTGASSGIGEAFARALAAQDMPCVLAARRVERLEALASELESQHGVETRIVASDLASLDGADRLVEAVADLDVGVLVNNAGFGAGGRFEKLDLDRLREMVQVNCVAPVTLTWRLLPGFRKRGRGAILFVGSTTGRQPVPLQAVYSATKAFALMLGESLWAELCDDGVDVLVLEPGATETEFQQVAGELPHAGESAASVAANALRALGRQPSVISGWRNWALALLATRLGPRPVVAFVAHEMSASEMRLEMR